jgi:ribosomal protein S18 acetylase RimI-like enzyme
MLTASLAGATQEEAALRVWHRANAARGLPPTREREARVRDKVREVDALLLAATDDSLVVGMLLLEPGRAGPDSPYGHVSMVFVDPERWGRGIGGELLDAATALARERDWLALSLWTRTSNEQAQRLYAKHGFRDTGDAARLANRDHIGRWLLPVEPRR